MQDSEMTLLPVQPFIKLMQNNMQLLMQFSMSPEVVSQSLSQWQDLMQRNQGTAANIAQSGAFAELLQGLMKNYVQFVGEIAQASVSMLTQASVATVNRMHEAGEAATNGSGHRSSRQPRA